MRHQVNIQVPAEDYHELRRQVAARKADEPTGYSIGDAVRTYIARGLRADGRKPRPPAEDPRKEHVRQLHGIARSALKMARELKA